MIMHLIATGEGPTDIGSCRNGSGVSHDENFLHGPMYELFLKLLESCLPDWNQGQELSHTFVYRKELGQKAKASKVRLPSTDKVVKGHLEHAKRAAALAEMTKENFPDTWANSLSVYFHDCDGTRSELDREPDMQENRVKAVLSGFRAAEYNYGIAMIPKPTSESWIICSVKDNPYCHCDILETDLSGNDRSLERAPKIVLGNAIDNQSYTRTDLGALIANIDINRLDDMPSFKQLKQNIINAVQIACGTVGNQS